MANKLQEAYSELLLDRIRGERYPSVTYMDMLEEIATPQVMVEYTMHLFERIESETFPSPPMMKRVNGLVARWGLERPPG